MHNFLIWLEASGLSTWIREEPAIYAFPSILTAHTIGMGLVAGVNALLALRILGAAPEVPLVELRRFFPVMWFGFWLNAISGVGLLIAYPTKAITNPVFYAKLIFIAAAMLLMRAIQKQFFGHPARVQVDQATRRPRARMLAWGSLGCWAAAIAAGRFLAYTYHHLLSTD